MNRIQAVAAVDRVIEERSTALLDLTVELMSIDSQIPPYADERAIVEFLRERLPEMGLPAGEVIGPSPERPSLIVRIPGKGGGRNLMLNGHLDTKPVGDARPLWRTDPLTPTVIDGTLYGLGANDMKGAIAAMVCAASALQSTATELDGDLVLGFVADEEDGANHGAKFVAPLIRDVDAALIGEPSGWQHDWQGIHLVSRGVCCFRIVVHGTQMHSSLSDRLPSINASERLAGLLARIRDELEFSFIPHRLGGIGSTFNPGVMISGGTNFGVVPGRAEFACDLRTVPGMTIGDVRQSLEAWLETCRAEDPELNVEVHFEPDLEWIPWSELPEAHELVPAVQGAALEVLGETPPLSVFPGGTDAPWFEAAGIPTLPSFGPGMLTSAHGPNEFVSVSSLSEATRMYARIAIDFCSKPVN